jgi:hypothetical protein
MGTAPENDGSLQLGSVKDDQQQRQYSGFTFQTTATVPAAMAGTNATASSFLQSSMPMAAQLVRRLI